jgi:hypothetical protein
MAARNKPNYQRETGAYSTVPRVQACNDGFSATGSIECWRGSREDLQRVVQLAADALARDDLEPNIRVIATDWSGVSQNYDSVADWSLNTGDALEQLGTLRIEIHTEGLTAAVVVRRKIPGVTVAVKGLSTLRVDSFARLLHRTLMRGYVDRYGGWWRPAAAIALTLVPAGLFFSGISATAGEVPAGVTALASVAALVACFFIMVNSWQWTLVRKPIEFVRDEAVIETPITARVRAWRRHPRVLQILALAGVVLISIVANKLSDLIPWP